MPSSRLRSDSSASRDVGASGYSVRRATIVDIDRLPDIERSAGQAFLTIPDLAWLADDDILSEADHRRLIEHGAIWVAVDHRDVPVGFVCGEEKGDNFHIRELAVRRDLQGCGVGTALIATVKDWATTKDLAAEKDCAPTQELAAEKGWAPTKDRATKDWATAKDLATKDRASARRISALSLTTFRHVPWNAPFYAKLGFVILAEQDLPDWMRLILLEEAAAGLPVERRCAMVLRLAAD